MGSIGPSEMLVIAFIIVLLFGAGRISEIGKGLGQGIRNFKQGLRDDEKPDAEPSQLQRDIAVVGAPVVLLPAATTRVGAEAKQTNPS